MDLGTHQFVLENFEDLKPLAKSLANESLAEAKKRRQIRSKNPILLSAFEFYCMDVFQKSLAMIECIHRINTALIFLQRFPSPKTYLSKGINQFSWLEYHYSYFVISYVSVFDIGLILTNTVLRLGNSEKNCKSHIILENSWVNSSGVAKALKVIERNIKPYQNPRNLHVHRGELPDIKEKVDYDMMNGLQIFDFFQLHNKPLIDLNELHYLYKDQEFLLSEKLLEDIKTISSSIEELFNVLAPIYSSSKLSLRLK